MRLIELDFSNADIKMINLVKYDIALNILNTPRPN